MIKRLLIKLYSYFNNSDKKMKNYTDKLRRKGMQIGYNNYIGGVTFGRGGQDPILIGNDCTLTMCTVLGHDASPTMYIEELRGKGINNRISLKKQTVIKDRCFVGVNAVLMPGVTIGPDCIVGAGSVVTKDFPPKVVIAGNPAKIICSLEEYIQKHKKQIKEHPEWYPGI